jgi:hypothetical protein
MTLHLVRNGVIDADDERTGIKDYDETQRMHHDR